MRCISYSENELTDSLNEGVDPETNKEVRPEHSRNGFRVLHVSEWCRARLLNRSRRIDRVQIDVTEEPHHPPTSDNNREDGRHKHRRPHVVHELRGCLRREVSRMNEGNHSPLTLMMAIACLIFVRRQRKMMKQRKAKAQMMTAMYK